MSALAIASLVMSAVGTAASAIGSAVANKRREDTIRKNRADENAWYQREFYQDFLNRSENAAALRSLRTNLKDYNQTADAKANIMGATPEARLAARNKGNQAYADAISRIAGNASRYRDSVGRSWMNSKRYYNDQDAALEAQRAQSWGVIANNAANLGSAAISALEGTANTGSTLDTPTSNKVAPGINKVDKNIKNG